MTHRVFSKAAPSSRSRWNGCAPGGQGEIEAETAQPGNALAAETLAQRFGDPALALAVTGERQPAVGREMRAVRLERRHQAVHARAAARGDGQRPGAASRRRAAVASDSAPATSARARSAAAPRSALVTDDQVRDLDDARLHELQRIARAGLHAEHHGVGDARHVGLRLADAHGLDQHAVEQARASPPWPRASGRPARPAGRGRPWSARSCPRRRCRGRCARGRPAARRRSTWRTDRRRSRRPSGRPCARPRPGRRTARTCRRPAGR